MNYKNFNLGDWIDHISGVIADESELDGNEMRDLVEFLSMLKQEPDDYIIVPKKALKYRTAGMVAYNAEWLKNHFDIERAVICGAQQPCEDAISRQAVIEITAETGAIETQVRVKALPLVNPQPKTGHWIKIKPYPLQMHDYECSECLRETDDPTENYCSECGARMVEPQESEDKCKNCEYYLNPDYTRCHECKAESEVEE